MFENVLYQNVTSLLKADLHKNMLPNSILFSGPVSSGKLTTALELARVLSCKGNGKVKGSWDCTCPSCLKHKSLVSSDVLIAGSKDCSLEIFASKDVFLQALKENKSYVQSANYLFVRSVRKLTSRFNPIFFEGDDKASKISPYIQTIDELLEDLDPVLRKTDFDKTEQNCEKIVTQCKKLENLFMYDSVPISHIRNAQVWAQMTNTSGKKILVLENADRMNDSARNALLKILEEPPENTVFILTTNRKGAILNTILSRVRTYNFSNRSLDQQTEVLQRVFHHEGSNINEFLTSYLPVEREKILLESNNFLDSINKRQMCNLENISKELEGFEPRIIFKIFLENFFIRGREKIRVEDFKRNNILYSEKQGVLLKAVNECYENVTIYNQNPVASLEKLQGELI